MLVVLMAHSAILAIVFLLWQLIRYAPRRQEREFGFTAVALIACLNVLSLLGGFSIGWVLSILNTVLGLLLIALTTHYIRQILFVTSVSFLLSLSLRGHFWPAFYVLPALLTATAVGGVVRAIYGWRNREEQTFSSAGVVMVACFAGLALLVSRQSLSFAVGLALFTAGVSAFMGILSKRYSLYVFVIGAFSLLWATHLFLEL